MLIKHDCIIRAVTRYAVAALLASAAVLAVAQPNDGDFAAARDAYRAGDAARLAGIAPRLAGHLLESYVEYWQLKLGLDDAETERVRAFLDRYAGTPLSDRLRADWLKVLGKRGDWTTFESEFPKHVGEDTELACYAIQAQRQRIGDSVLEDARRYWFTGQDQPDACQSLFVAMQATGRLTSQDLWARFRLAHEAGNYRLVGRIASSLPLAERPAQRELDRIDRGALAVLLKGGYRVTSPAARELALYALDRVARSDAAAAHEAWLKCRRRFPQAEQSYGNLIVAYNASRQLLPGANQWYRETGGAALNDYQHAWRVRAALRAGAWEGVAQAIDAMPEAQSQEPAWRYWKARALSTMGQEEDAVRLFGSLVGEHHFYSFLAAEAIGAGIKPVSEPLVSAPAALATFAARDDVRRVVRLTEFDLRSDAQREWRQIVHGMEDDELLLAAEFARRQQLYDRSINTAERTRRRHDFTLRFPMPYRTEIEEAAQRYDLDEALMFGLARQESRFTSNIVSAAGAVGLMQIMPTTAGWAARKLDLIYRADTLDEPALNAKLGAYYLRHVLDQLDGLPVLAAAAYNAGPGRARAWRASVPLEGAVYAETIPFNETRDYVKKVLANAMFYQAQLGLPYISLRERLGVVNPRGWNADADTTAAFPLQRTDMAR